MKRKSLAIVGCGAVAQRCHVPALALQEGFELSAVFDTDPRHSEALVSAYRQATGATGTVHTASSLEEVAGLAQAALIATPHRHHADVATRLLSRGVHCLVEKSMALTMAECEHMQAAARAHGVLLGAAHVRRLYPGSQFVHRLLREGRLGAVRRMDWREGAPYDWPLTTSSLFDATQSGGGVLSDTGPHVLDLLGWWLDFPHATDLVYRDSSRGGVEAEAELSMRMGEVEVFVRMSRLRWQRNTCVIVGSSATLELGTDTPSNYEIKNTDGTLREAGLVPTWPPAVDGWETLFARQFSNFSAAMEGAEALLCPGDEAARAVGLIERCYLNRTQLPMTWRDRVDL
jgi:predicted dehydrogenase